LLPARTGLLFVACRAVACRGAKALVVHRLAVGGVRLVADGLAPTGTGWLPETPDLSVHLSCRNDGLVGRRGTSTIGFPRRQRI
jgi:hypothetical protein